VTGLDSVHRHEFIILGAHFDHLGHSPTWAMDRDAGFVLRPGADDNASGTAAVLDLARRFADRAAKRSILFVNFDAEEVGLVGSRAFLARTAIPRTAMSFMINLDMVGRLRGDRLFVASRPMTPGLRAIFDTAAKVVGIRLQLVTSDDRSDQASFEDEGVAAAGLTTGMHADYHKATDVPNRLNMEGLSRVVDLAEFVVRRIADR
jgi:Zn-dependent M28 family amino/carboxypeptidase